MSDKVYFEHVVEFADPKCSANEERVLHLLQLAKLNVLVSVHPKIEPNQEVLEFLTCLRVKEDGSLSTRVTYGLDASATKRSTKKLWLSPNFLYELLNVNNTREDPTMYMAGQEQEYLDQINCSD